MKSGRIRIIRWCVLAILVLATFLFRWIPGWGEWYTLRVYPSVSACLSFFSSPFPFSVGDCFIVLGTCWIIGNVVFAIIKRRKGGKIWLRTMEFCGWVYIWFYFAWGINYFRQPFNERMGIGRAQYSPENFQAFLKNYTRELNRSYALSGDSLSGWYLELAHGSEFIRNLDVEKVVGHEYRSIAGSFGLVFEEKDLKAKPMLWSGGMSKMGITGYMGPFFSEFNMNRDELSVEYPFTYAHELAHRLGIASEAEANLYAFLACSQSEVAEIRFSGYFAILGYVMNNARRLLSEQEYIELYREIGPGIIGLYMVHRNYWREKYNPGAGKVQNKVYNAYLKANKVESGTKNYSEMVGLLVSLQEYMKNNREIPDSGELL